MLITAAAEAETGREIYAGAETLGRVLGDGRDG